jgi:hypothetical protein
LKKWFPNSRDRAVLRTAGVFFTRRNDTATIEQVIAGIPGKPRYFVVSTARLERLLCEKQSGQTSKNNLVNKQ